MRRFVGGWWPLECLPRTFRCRARARGVWDVQVPPAKGFSLQSHSHVYYIVVAASRTNDRQAFAFFHNGRSLLACNVSPCVSKYILCARVFACGNGFAVLWAVGSGPPHPASLRVRVVPRRNLYYIEVSVCMNVLRQWAALPLCFAAMHRVGFPLAFPIWLFVGTLENEINIHDAKYRRVVNICSVALDANRRRPVCAGQVSSLTVNRNYRIKHVKECIYFN